LHCIYIPHCFCTSGDIVFEKREFFEPLVGISIVKQERNSKKNAQKRHESAK
jgi:hypothetical protein